MLPSSPADSDRYNWKPSLFLIVSIPHSRGHSRPKKPIQPETGDWITQPALKVYRNPVAADEGERQEEWSILHKRKSYG